VRPERDSQVATRKMDELAGKEMTDKGDLIFTASDRRELAFTDVSMEARGACKIFKDGMQQGY
jgi:hypothetical protein